MTQMEDYDIKYVGPRTWATVVGWYGGGPAFPRKVILRGWQESLELHPQPVSVRTVKPDGSPSDASVSALVSRLATGPNIVEQLAAQLGVNAASSRLWAKVGAQLGPVQIVAAVEG